MKRAWDTGIWSFSSFGGEIEQNQLLMTFLSVSGSWGRSRAVGEGAVL